MTQSNPPSLRPLGARRLPRRRFVPPTAVRAAQVLVVLRIALVLGLVLAAGGRAIPTSVIVGGVLHLTLPGGDAWSGVAHWVLLAAVFETGLVLMLGGLQAGSRRVILAVESAAVAVCGLYVAAGLESGLVPMVIAIAVLVLLRLDHVRHSFARAGAARRVMRHDVQAVLFDGYAPPDPLAIKEVQRIGYRAASGPEVAASAPPEMSTA